MFAVSAATAARFAFVVLDALIASFINPLLVVGMHRVVLGHFNGLFTSCQPNPYACTQLDIL